MSTIVPAPTPTSTTSTVGASVEPWCTKTSVLVPEVAISLPAAKTDKPKGCGLS